MGAGRLRRAREDDRRGNTAARPGGRGGPARLAPGWYPPGLVRAYLGLKADELDALPLRSWWNLGGPGGAGEVQNPAGRALCRLLVASPAVLRTYKASCGGYDEASGEVTALEG